MSSLPTTLIVDDVQIIRYGIARTIELAGFQVVGLARDGREALALAQEHHPDLVLLDVVMPIMQGTEALPILRALLPHSLIIMLTSTSERQLALHCKALGADDYIIKSTELLGGLSDRLVDRWTRHVGNTGSSQAPVEPFSHS